MVAVLALSASGCAKRVYTADPLGNRTLLPPCPSSYEEAPTDKISVQYAVIEIAKQAGVGYEWNISAAYADPIRRLWSTPVILNQPLSKALKTILRPVNLTYTIARGKIIIGQRR
jgi:hypothetical protein